jgi:pimeloyl-ACP methyl ester carboxylesterase
MARRVEFDIAAWSLVAMAKGSQSLLAGTSLFSRRPGILVAGLETALPLDLRGDGIDNDIVQMNGLPPLPLADIQAPTLLVHGKRDTIVPYSFSEKASRAIPGASLMTLDKGGHMDTPLDPGSIDTIRGFLAE